MSRRHGPSIAVLGPVLLVAPAPARATVEMQNQAGKLGFAVENGLDCHASSQALAPNP